ncbi:MAG TPA: hypothetical protein VMW11_02670 [Candidatus Dormibacteraeota bacterium]|nr:hypothetical protein [Candidatus Dormibacteraeota bacterium]
MARTMVMASPVASTVARAAAVAGAPAVEARNADEPVVLAYPSPPPPLAKKKSRKGLFAGVAGVMVLILALVGLGIYEYLNQPLQLTVTPSTVVAGDSILVTASHLPANQAGEIQVWSQRRIVPFHAGPGGNVVVQVSIPRDLEVGEHLVMICWNGACHSQQKLQVLAPVALPTPIAPASPSPAASSSPSPSPIATPAASLSISKTSVPMYSTIYVSGVHFSSSRAVTIALFDPASSTLTLESWSAVTTSGGGFGRTITLPATALAGNARITACDSDRVCATAYLKVT